MLDFKAKMHQIRFPLGPQVPLGELTALPQTSELYLRSLLLRGGRGKREGRGREGRGEWEGKVALSL